MKIFQIGFNKCGTRSLHNFFENNNIRSVHYHGGTLAKKIHENFNENLPLLKDIENYQFYSDMEFVSKDKIITGYSFYRILDMQYPNSIFILNLRSKDKWLKSRSNHPGGNLLGDYLKRYMAYYNETRSEIIQRWSSDWDRHLAEVRSYFKGNDKFFEFDIERDDASKLSNFLIGHGFDIKHHTFPKIS